MDLRDGDYLLAVNGENCERRNSAEIEALIDAAPQGGKLTIQVANAIEAPLREQRELFATKMKLQRKFGTAVSARRIAYFGEGLPSSSSHVPTSTPECGTASSPNPTPECGTASSQPLSQALSGGLREARGGDGASGESRREAPKPAAAAVETPPAGVVNVFHPSGASYELALSKMSGVTSARIWKTTLWSMARF